MASKRIIITLSEEDKQWLESYSRTHQVPVAEAVRQGIRRLKDAESEKTYRTLVQSTRGIWRQGDGLEYQEELRCEWNSS